MAAYSLIASESTVQVMSPQLVYDIVYCTIQTSGHGVIASMPVSRVAFDNNGAAEELTAFADGIETIWGRGHVVAAVGAQTIDPNGLLQDQVAFTVSYTPPGGTPGTVTAEALVPVGLLSQSDPAIAATVLAEAEAIVTKVYDALVATAAG